MASSSRRNTTATNNKSRNILSDIGGIIINSSRSQLPPRLYILQIATGAFGGLGLHPGDTLEDIADLHHFANSIENQIVSIFGPSRSAWVQCDADNPVIVELALLLFSYEIENGRFAEEFPYGFDRRYGPHIEAAMAHLLTATNTYDFYADMEGIHALDRCPGDDNENPYRPLFTPEQLRELRRERPNSTSKADDQEISTVRQGKQKQTIPDPGDDSNTPNIEPQPTPTNRRHTTTQRETELAATQASPSPNEGPAYPHQQPSGGGYSSDIENEYSAHSRQQIPGRRIVYKSNVNNKEPTDRERATAQQAAERAATQATPIPRGDPALEHRQRSRARFEAFDNDYGRYVVRAGNELTLVDLRALQRGPNNIIDLAIAHLNVSREVFLNWVFHKWNSGTPPGDQPCKGTMSKNDVSLVIGNFSEDQYTQSERKAAQSMQLHPSQLPNIKPRPAHRQRGAEALLKVRPGRNSPHISYVDSKQSFANQESIDLAPPQSFADYLRAALVQYDIADEAICYKYNRDFLVWLARRRIHIAYNYHEVIPWTAQVAHGPVQNEPNFTVNIPSRTCLQMLGVQLSDLRQTAGATALLPDDTRPNGVRVTGLPHEVHAATAYAQRMQNRGPATRQSRKRSLSNQQPTTSKHSRTFEVREDTADADRDIETEAEDEE
jgi:hypothetical protein